jgi:hypothetical protein
MKGWLAHALGEVVARLASDEPKSFENPKGIAPSSAAAYHTRVIRRSEEDRFR